MEIKYGVCSICGQDLVPIWFIEEETVTKNGILYYTGRTRRAVSHLTCPHCGNNECVDDTFDGPWRQ